MGKAYVPFNHLDKFFSTSSTLSENDISRRKIISTILCQRFLNVHSYPWIRFLDELYLNAGLLKLELSPVAQSLISAAKQLVGTAKFNEMTKDIDSTAQKKQADDENTELKNFEKKELPIVVNKDKQMQMKLKQMVTSRYARYASAWKKNGSNADQGSSEPANLTKSDRAQRFRSRGSPMVQQKSNWIQNTTPRQSLHKLRLLGRFGRTLCCRTNNHHCHHHHHHHQCSNCQNKNTCNKNCNCSSCQKKPAAVTVVIKTTSQSSSTITIDQNAQLKDNNLGDFSSDVNVFGSSMLENAGDCQADSVAMENWHKHRPMNSTMAWF